MRRKPSRRELEKERERALIAYDEANSKVHILTYSTRHPPKGSDPVIAGLVERALWPEGDALKKNAVRERKAARERLQAAADALRPTPPNTKARKKPRKIVQRDHYPTDRSKFIQWVWHQVDDFEDSDGVSGVDLADLSARSGVRRQKLEYLVESTRAKGDATSPKFIPSTRDGRPGRKLAPLYPTEQEIDACIAACTYRGDYFESGLSGANQLVAFLLLLLEQRKISNAELSRATSIPLKTIESWSAGNPTNRREPTLNDLVACFEELGRPLVPAHERNSSAVFLHEFAALQVEYATKTKLRPDYRRMPIPTKRA